MCGIFAILDSSFDESFYSRLWECSRRILNSRGPDGASYLPIAGRGAIAGTRLAIVDGQNAAASNVRKTPNGQFYLAFNGEIYNYKRLLKLVPDWSFETDSDTEVLLALITTHGLDYALEVIEGMFAFIFYDRASNVLSCAIDEAGQKPLYYRNLPEGGWLFSSDIRCLLSKELSQLTLCKRSLSQALLFRFIPDGRTHFKEIRKLQPGQKIVFSAQGCDPQIYRSIKVSQYIESPTATIVANIRQAFLDSVEMTLGPEEEIALFLSGGVDSTAVAAAAQSFGRKVATYSIGFEDVPGPVFSHLWAPDEFEYSRLAAKQLGSRHHEYRMSMRDYFEIFADWSVTQGDPLLVLDAMPLLFLSQKVSQEFKYVLTGSGSDEIFDGYQMGDLTDSTYLASTSKSVAELLENYLMLNARSYGADLKRLLKNTDGWSQELDLLRASLSSYDLSQLNLFTMAKLLMCRGRRAYYEFAMLDRTGMAYSLEARNPFAQRPVVYSAFAVPPELHGLNGMPKGVLREALSGLLPDNIRLRPKAPFVMPSSFFFGQEFMDLAQILFKPDCILVSLGIVEKDYLSELWKSEVQTYRAIFPRIVQLELLLQSQAPYFTLAS